MAAAARLRSVVGHVVGPLGAVEVAKVVLLRRIRKPPCVFDDVGRLIEGRHETTGWSGG
ncbi:MAG: hypothetical protein OEW83_10985 [Acidimicrobiia bacterium]|nr:hypothetical protein [Acidimicrobiia bacterium]